MFALQFGEYGGPEVLAVGAANEPHAGPGEIRIAVRATGVSPGDGKIRSGRYQEFLSLQLPHIPGADAAGIVDEIGEGVTGLSLGDAVFGLRYATMGGAAAEFAVLEAWTLKPDAFTWEEAGGAASGVETTVRVLDELAVRDGQTILIDGAAGGVGAMSIQLALARGATVIGTGSVGSQEFIASFGAIPTTYGPGLVERVKAISPKGVDAVMDVAGMGSLRDLINIAGTPEKVVTIAEANELGVKLSRPAQHAGSPYEKEGLLWAARLAAEGRFSVPLYASFTLNEGPKAHELSDSGHARGKIVMTVP